MAKAEINPAVLRWALEDSAFDANDLAEATGRPLQAAAAWLTGDDYPHGADLRKIASLVGRSTQFFYLPTPPVKRNYEASFRSTYGSGPQEGLLPQEIAAVRSALQIQKVAVWAADDSPFVDIPPPVEDAEEYASKVRDWLEWDPSEQVKATSKTRAFKLIRSRIEERGVIVLLRDIGPDSCRGFSLYHKKAPLILVNKGYSYYGRPLASVRSFTLLHELAHLAFREEAICRDSDIARERWCDRFAASFLIPREHLLSYCEKTLKKNSVPGNDIDSVRRVANRYKTSYQAAARRLRDVGLADHSLVSFINSNPIEKDDSGFSPNVRTTSVIRADEFGITYPKLLLDAISRQKLNSLDARRYLRVNGTQLNELRSVVEAFV